MGLSSRQRATLSAVCETLLAGERGMEQTTRRVEGLMDALPDPGTACVWVCCCERWTGPW